MTVIINFKKPQLLDNKDFAYYNNIDYMTFKMHYILLKKNRNVVAYIKTDSVKNVKTSWD